MLVIPAIDIYKNKCVRLYKGDYEQSTIYSDDPIEVIKNWELKGANLIHIVDLEGAKLGTTISSNLIQNMINNTNTRIQIGGGIRNLEIINYYLSLGVERIILGSAAIKNENNIVKTSIKKYGSDKIIVSVDSSRGRIKTEGWTRETQLTPEDLIHNMLKMGVKKFIYTDIDRDGTFKGVSIKNIKIILKKFNIQLTVAGGISSKFDLEALDKLGVKSVIIGKAFYEENRLDPISIIEKYKG